MVTDLRQIKVKWFLFQKPLFKLTTECRRSRTMSPLRLTGDGGISVSFERARHRPRASMLVWHCDRSKKTLRQGTASLQKFASSSMGRWRSEERRVGKEC